MTEKRDNRSRPFCNLEDNLRWLSFANFSCSCDCHYLRVCPRKLLQMPVQKKSPVLNAHKAWVTRVMMSRLEHHPMVRVMGSWWGSLRINVTRKNLIAHCFYIAKISYSYAPLKLRLHGAKSRGDLTQVGLRDNKLFSALILTTRGVNSLSVALDARGKRGRRVLRG